MNISSKTSIMFAKALLLLFSLVIVAIFLMNGPVTSSVAGQEERVFENAIPENAPIQIKIKKQKEQSFKALKNEN